MKIVISTGSPWSSVNQVGGILNSAGLQIPVQPDNSDLTVESLHAQIEKAEKINSRTSTVQPIQLGKKWEQQALDILHANQGKEVWGWANPFSTWLLDFWKSLDPNIYFVLVYSSPEEDVARFMMEEIEFTQAGNTPADVWFSYNTQLLRFYNRNRERCILVGKNAACGNPSSLLGYCNKNFGLLLKTDVVATHTEGHEYDAVSLALARSGLENRDDLHRLYDEIQATATQVEAEGSPTILDTAWLAYRQTLLTNKKQQEQLKLSEIKQAENTADSKQFQSKSKELEQENELLLLQLHQVQEELEHYFLLYQECQKKEEKQKARPQAKERLNLKMSELPPGTSWYPVEEVDEGTLRWSGPEPRATLMLPIKRDKKQLLVIQYKQVLAQEQIEGIRVEVDGEPAGHQVYDKIIPKCIAVELTAVTGELSSKTELALILPLMIKPSEIAPGSPDERSLGIAVYGISVLPLKPRVNISWPETIFKRQKLKRGVKKIAGAIDNFPLAYFDGMAYLQKYPDVAEAVRKGTIPSAFIHYVQNGHHDGHNFILADAQFPSEGNVHDLMQIQNA